MFHHGTVEHLELVEHVLGLYIINHLELKN